MKYKICLSVYFLYQNKASFAVFKLAFSAANFAVTFQAMPPAIVLCRLRVGIPFTKVTSN